MIEAIERAAGNEGIAFSELARDYRWIMARWFRSIIFHEAGWAGPVVVIGFTIQSNETHLAFGGAIARAASSLNRRAALVASSDLSHGLVVGGPYEYEPTAHLFDEQIVEAIATGNAGNVINIDQKLKERAGECGYRSIVIALGSVDENLRDHQVLSYEGPFGVGYMVAVIVDENQNQI